MLEIDIEDYITEQLKDVDCELERHDFIDFYFQDRDGIQLRVGEYECYKYLSEYAISKGAKIGDIVYIYWKPILI